MIVVELWLDFMSKLSYDFCPIPILRFMTGIPLNLFFDMFEPVIQAYIFTILTAVNLKEGMLSSLQVYYNRARQAQITDQIIEIVAGSEAQNGR